MAGADLTGKSVRRRTVYAKIETPSGTPATGISSEDAILAKSIDVTPLESNTVAREFIRDSFGGFSEIIVARQSSVTIEVDFRDPLTGNIIPEIDTLFRMCGMDRYHLTDPTTPRYVTESGAIILPTEVDAADKGVAYRPTSGLREVAAGDTPNGFIDSPSPGFCTGTIRVFADGKVHEISGAMGTFTLNMSVAELPSVTFTFTGNYLKPTDLARPAGNAGNRLPVPLVVSNDNTRLMFPDTLNNKMYNFSYDAGNEITRPAVVGTGISTRLVNRTSTGSIEVQSSAVSQNDPWAIMGTGTTQALTIRHQGSIANPYIDVALPRCAFGAGTYGDQDSIETLVIPLQMIASDEGNDEIQITYYNPV